MGTWQERVKRTSSEQAAGDLKLEQEKISRIRREKMLIKEGFDEAIRTFEIKEILTEIQNDLWKMGEIEQLESSDLDSYRSRFSLSVPISTIAVASVNTAKYHEGSYGHGGEGSSDQGCEGFWDPPSYKFVEAHIENKEISLGVCFNTDRCYFVGQPRRYLEPTPVSPRYMTIFSSSLSPENTDITRIVVEPNGNKYPLVDDHSKTYDMYCDSFTPEKFKRLMVDIIGGKHNSFKYTDPNQIVQANKELMAHMPLEFQEKRNGSREEFYKWLNLKPPTKIVNQRKRDYWDF